MRCCAGRTGSQGLPAGRWKPLVIRTLAERCRALRYFLALLGSASCGVADAARALAEPRGRRPGFRGRGWRRASCRVALLSFQYVARGPRYLAELCQSVLEGHVTFTKKRVSLVVVKPQGTRTRVHFPAFATSSP